MVRLAWEYDDDEGNFDFDKVNIGGLFWESAIETLLDMGFKGKTDEIMSTLMAKVDAVQKQLVKTMGEAAGINTTSEMTGKVAGKTVEKIKE